MKKRSIKRWKAIAWQVCSEFNRKKMADKDGWVRCVSCGKVARWEDQQAGHIIDGRGGSILFCDEAIFPQCPRCNIFLNGNKVDYVRWFLDKFGMAKLDELSALAKQPLKRRAEDYAELIETYKRKILELGG